jgi:radical SAM superfamily enzyme YgiQ (UPF0313 family)
MPPKRPLRADTLPNKALHGADAGNLDMLFIHAEAGISPIAFETTLPPLGLVELATYLNAQNFRTRVIDARHKDFSIEWLFDFLSEAKPRWVGLSVLTDTVFTVMRLAGLVRRASPQSRIVLGGAHATLMPDDVLAMIDADVVVIGEGEIPCAEILAGKTLHEVHGIAFRDGGKTVKTPVSPRFDMDLLPPIDYGAIINVGGLTYSPSVHTGRGCPYRCSFCAAPILGPKVRWRRVDLVMQDIEAAAIACNSRYISISDDTFTYDPRRIADFCKAIERIGGGTDLFWYAEGRIDRLAAYPELIGTMKRAGLRYLQLGVETGDQRVLDAYRKGITFDQVRTVLRALAQEGILIHAGFIIGGPFETPETIATTQNFIDELIEICGGLLQVKPTFLNPLPGTPIYEHPADFGIENLDPGLLSSVGFDNAITQTESLSREEIFHAHRDMSITSAEHLRTTFDRQSAAFHDACRELLAQLGPVHISLSFLSALPLAKMGRIFFDTTMENTERYAQFFRNAHDHALDLIPARLPFFTMGEDGTYFLQLHGTHLTQEESDVFHYCSGKLTGSEIATILDVSDEAVKKALKGLEGKNAIVYRTY